MFAFLAAHGVGCSRRSCSPICFRPGGAAELAPEVVATVLVLQALHGLSDREAVEALTLRLRWKAACGLAITDTAFDPSR